MLGGVMGGARAQSAERLHVLVVLDASGSVLLDAEVRAAAARMLGDLPARLTEGRIDGLPPLTPDDAVSFVTFGVYDGPLPAYRGLREVDLLSDYVRPVALWRRGMDRAALERLLRLPRDAYQLSLLSLAQPLALAAAAAPPGEAADRTVLVLISDGQTNAVDIREEEAMVRRFGAPVPTARALDVVARVRAGYRFGDADGRPLWSDAVDDAGGRLLLFTEALEVTPAAEAAWRADRPDAVLADVRTTWAPADSVTVEAVLAPAFERWATAGGDSVAVGLVSSADPGRAPAPALTLAAPADGCAPGAVEAAAAVRATRADPTLGLRTARLDLPVTLDLAPTPACTRTYWAARVGWALLAAGLVGLVGFLAAARATGRHLWIRIPSYRRGYALRRGREVEIDVPFPPAPGREAFTLHLPPRWLQWTAYYGATLDLGSRAGGEVRWSDGAASLRIPRRGARDPRRALAVWTRTSPDLSTITLSLGGPVARLHFPDDRRLSSPHS